MKLKYSIIILFIFLIALAPQIIGSEPSSVDKFNSGCKYDPDISEINYMKTYLDLGDYYWDPDEDEKTLIVGHPIDIKTVCSFNDAHVTMTELRQDTDNTDSENNYEKIWSMSSTDSPEFRYSTFMPSESHVKDWGLGWSYCEVEYEGNPLARVSYNTCDIMQDFIIQECLPEGVNQITGATEYNIGCLSGKVCYDDDSSTSANTCVSCECSDGPCCSDGCNYDLAQTPCGTTNCDHLDSECIDYHNVERLCNGDGICLEGLCKLFTNDNGSTLCDEGYGKEYSCINGTESGMDVYFQYLEQFCGIDTGNCDGAVIGNGNWHLHDNCLENEYCVEGEPFCVTSRVIINMTAPSQITEPFTALVNIDYVENIDVAEFNISFNNTLLSLTSIEPIGIMTNASIVYSDSTHILLNLPGIKGQTGSGDILSLNFTPKQSVPETEILINSVLLGNTSAQPIKVWKHEGTSFQINLLCVENWTCTEWTECIDNWQNRICVDQNECGTELNKPLLIQECNNCNNGIKDGDEEGIDCGGSCPNQDCCTNGFKDIGEYRIDCGGNCGEYCMDCYGKFCIWFPCSPENFTGLINYNYSGIDKKECLPDYGFGCYDDGDCSPEYMCKSDESISQYGSNSFCCEATECSGGNGGCFPSGTDATSYMGHFWCNNGEWVKFDCSNAIKDPNEEGIDCGGVCKNSCDCTIPTNSMNITKSTTFCNGSYFLPDGIYIDMIEDNSILDCNGAELIGDGKGIGINSMIQNYTLRICKNITIRNCVITNYYEGLWMWDFINSNIHNNHFVNNIRGMWADHIYNSQIKNNIFNNNIRGLIIDWGYTDFSGHNTIINNTFNGTQTYSGIYIKGQEYLNLIGFYEQNLFCINCIGNYFYGQSDGPRCPDECGNCSAHNEIVENICCQGLIPKIDLNPKDGELCCYDSECAFEYICVQSGTQISEYHSICTNGEWVSICVENWTCTEWTECLDSWQNRTCIDSNQCGTELNKPPLSQECNTCNNSIKDGNETGIDCGGSCPNQDCCTNGFKDLDEEGIDCGGSCAPCFNPYEEFIVAHTDGEYAATVDVNDNMYLITWTCRLYPYNNGGSDKCMVQQFDLNANEISEEWILNTNGCIGGIDLYSNNNFLLVHHTFAGGTRVHKQDENNNQLAYNSMGWYGMQSIAALDNGSYVVIAFNNWEIYGQILNNNGAPITNQFRVNDYTTGQQHHPNVEKIGDNFIVVWDSQQDGSERGIYGKIYNQQGNIIVNEFKINDYTNDDQFFGSVGVGNNRFVVVWNSQSQDGSDLGVFGKIYNLTGEEISNEFQVNTITNGIQKEGIESDRKPVGMAHDGRFVVVWSGYTQEGQAIFGQKFNPDGTKNGQEFRISDDYDTEFEGYEPSIAFDNSNNRFFVIWLKEKTTYINSPEDRQIVGKLIDWTHENSCNDGLQNGDEEGIDCGGSCPNECIIESTCIDGIQNGDEEGIDCGGSCPNVCLCEIVIFKDDAESGNIKDNWIFWAGDISNAYYTSTVSANGNRSIYLDGNSNQEQPRIGGDTGVVLRKGLPKIKNVHFSFDFYDTMDMDIRNGVALNQNLTKPPWYGWMMEICPKDGTVNNPNVYKLHQRYPYDSFIITGSSVLRSEGWHHGEIIINSSGSKYYIDGILEQNNNKVSYVDMMTLAAGVHAQPGISYIDNILITSLMDCNSNTCSDGIQNGDETGIDCGGSCPNECIIKPTCTDGIQNGDEEGIDCGGSCPNACVIEPTCTDGIQNGDEEGIDCGDVCNVLCIDGKGEFKIAHSSGGDFFPKIISNDNLFLIGWRNRPWDYGSGSNGKCYTQQFDFSGNEINPEWQLNSNGCAISIDLYPNNNLIFANSRSPGIITTQQYDGNGNPITSEINLGPEYAPSTAVLSNGNYVVVWYKDDGSSGGISGQLFDNAGNKIGGEFRANTQTSQSQHHPVVAKISDSQFLVAWNSYNQDGSHYGIYGQMYGNNGNKLGEEFQINNYTTDEQRFPSIASNNNNQFVVVWNSKGQDGSGNGVFGQLFYFNGSKKDNEFQINTYTTDNQIQGQEHSRRSVAMRDDGKFIVVWSSANQEGTEGLYGQKFDSDGNKIDNEFRINSISSTDLTEAMNEGVVSFSGCETRFFVVWTRHEYPYSNSELDMQIFGKIFAWNDSPTCTDGIQNGDEEGIDCGGSCPNACEPLCDGTELLCDDFEDGDWTNNPTWTYWHTHGTPVVTSEAAYLSKDGLDFSNVYGTMLAVDIAAEPSYEKGFKGNYSVWVYDDGGNNGGCQDSLIETKIFHSNGQGDTIRLGRHHAHTGYNYGCVSESIGICPISWHYLSDGGLGWHLFEIHVLENSIEIYIDGYLVRDAQIDATIHKVLIGTNHDRHSGVKSYYDNVKLVENVYGNSCTDGIQNGDEEGIDCGGSCPNECIIESTCIDGIQNGDEEGIDCGGSCPNQDCCTNGYLDIGEYRIDCGGNCSEYCMDTYGEPWIWSSCSTSEQITYLSNDTFPSIDFKECSPDYGLGCNNSDDCEAGYICKTGESIIQYDFNNFCCEATECSGGNGGCFPSGAATSYLGSFWCNNGEWVESDCNNNIKDPNEEGIDCGGVCENSCDCTIPTNGMNITKSTTFCPGKYSLPDGIHINTIEDNSILDCNGAELIGIGKGFGINSILPNSTRLFKNITVKNCIITNYNVGLWFSGFINSSAYNNNFDYNIIGIWADNISKSQIKNNIFNYNIMGLTIDGECTTCSKYSTIINNTFNGSQAYSGIYIGGQESLNLTEFYEQNFFCIDCIGNYYYRQSDGPRCPDECNNCSAHHETAENACCQGLVPKINIASIDNELCCYDSECAFDDICVQSGTQIPVYNSICTNGEWVSSCVENWTCTEWSECTDSWQNRTCTDQNACGTELNKPQLAQECNVCTTPTNNLTITTTTTFCPGKYSLPDGIQINTIEDNSILDCNGAELIGIGKGLGINSILPNSSRLFKNITVKNCRITNYNTGLWFSGFVNSSAYNNKFDYNIIGIWADNISDTQIKNNFFNYNIMGLIIDGECTTCSKYSTIINNSFNGSQAYSGIYIGGQESLNLTEFYEQNFFCIDCIGNYYYRQSDGPRCPDECNNCSAHHETAKNACCQGLVPKIDIASIDNELCCYDSECAFDDLCVQSGTQIPEYNSICTNGKWVSSCTENWTCTEWTECTNSWQNRTCIDLNGCGTEQNKPQLAQECYDYNNSIAGSSRGSSSNRIFYTASISPTNSTYIPTRENKEDINNLTQDEAEEDTSEDIVIIPPKPANEQSIDEEEVSGLDAITGRFISNGNKYSGSNWISISILLIAIISIITYILVRRSR